MKHIVGLSILVSLLIFLSVTPSSAVRYVYPNDPYWTADVRSDGQGTTSGTPSAQITAQKPRSGNASLELSTSGDLGDWAFYTRFAGGVAQPWGALDNHTERWGKLSEINQLSFDWFRDTAINPQYDEGGSWKVEPFDIQTPVLRLLLGEKIVDSQLKEYFVYSELIWERWYNNNSLGAMGNVVDVWNSENLLGQNFWRHIISIESYTTEDGEISPYTHQQDLLAQNFDAWKTNYLTDPYVYGLSVGVGSQWPGEYLGFVDNVYLSFNNREGDVLFDNFELPTPVPEPGSWLLVGAGMGILALRRKFSCSRAEA